MSPKCTSFEGGGELCVKTAGICKEICSPEGAGGSGEDTPGGTDGAGGEHGNALMGQSVAYQCAGHVGL